MRFLISAILAMVFLGASWHAQAGEISNEELLKLVQAQAKQLDAMKKELDTLKSARTITPLRVSAGVKGVNTDEIRQIVKEEVASSVQKDATGIVENLIPESLRKLEIHGFVSQGYMWSEHNNYLTMNTEDGTAEWHDAGINFQSQVTDKLRLGLQLYTRDMGEMGNHEIELDWAFADYHWKDWLGLRVGKIKTPHGIYNETQDLEFLHTWILLPQGMYNLGVRSTKIAHMGVDLYGELPMKKFGSLSYKLYGGAFDMDEDGGYTRMLLTDGLDVSRYNEKFITGLDLKWTTPIKGLMLGWAYLTADLDITGNELFTGTRMPVSIGFQNNIHLNTLSLQYAWKNLLLTAEYQRFYFEYESEPPILAAMAAPDDEMRTWYVALAYRFTDWFELGTYYSRMYGAYLTERNNKQTQLNDWCVTARFDINPHWNVKLEGHFMDGAGVMGGVFNVDNPGGKSTDWNMFAIKTSFNF